MRRNKQNTDFSQGKVVGVSKSHVELRMGPVTLVYVGTRVSRSLADRFSRRCAELDCSPQETLIALIEAFVEGACGDPTEQREGLQEGFPPVGVPLGTSVEEEREPENLPKEENVWAFWRDMRHAVSGAEREPRLPFVITPFQN